MPGRTIESRERSRKTRRTKRLQNDQQHHKQPSQPQTSTQKCEKHLVHSYSFTVNAGTNNPEKGRSSHQSNRQDFWILLALFPKHPQMMNQMMTQINVHKLQYSKDFQRFPKIPRDCFLMRLPVEGNHELSE